MTESEQFIVIGGGIVGLATAWTLLQKRSATVTLLESEAAVAQHQSGHNSGVIHSGIYYKPGSSKALTCRRGKQLLEAFCRENEIPMDRCGKIIVATNGQELEMMKKIALRGDANGVDFEMIHSDQIRKLEPAAAGVAGLHVPETGIVDYAAVCRKLADQIRHRGGRILFGHEVVAIDTTATGIKVSTSKQAVFEGDHAIACGGLHSDQIYQRSGGEADIQIIPFRGEYYRFLPERKSLCRNLIYPVPDPAFPFLGVHVTRMINGDVECGPNAVPAFSREGYRWRDIRLSGLRETIANRGFQRMAKKHWRMGWAEMTRSLSKRKFVQAVQKLIPELRPEDVVRDRAGVRAQAVHRDGHLLDDFCIRKTPRCTHVLNAPSPAATASLAIAETIIESIESKDVGR